MCLLSYTLGTICPRSYLYLTSLWGHPHLEKGYITDTVFSVRKVYVLICVSECLLCDVSSPWHLPGCANRESSAGRHYSLRWALHEELRLQQGNEPNTTTHTHTETKQLTQTYTHSYTKQNRRTKYTLSVKTISGYYKDKERLSGLRIHKLANNSTTSHNDPFQYPS